MIDGKAKFRAVHRACQEDPKTSVPEEQIMRLFRGEWIENEKLKLHIVCMYKGLGVIDDDDIIDGDILRKQWAEQYSKEDYNKLLDCLIAYDTLIDTVWELRKCKQKAVNSIIEIETLWYDDKINKEGENTESTTIKLESRETWKNCF